MLKKIISLTLICSMTVFPTLAFAADVGQTTLDISKRLERVEDQQIEAQKKQEKLDGVLTELLARSDADRQTIRGQKDAEEKLPVAVKEGNESAIELHNIPDDRLGKGQDGQSIKQKIETCIGPIIDKVKGGGGKLSAEDAQALVQICPESKVKEIKDDLENRRQEALKSWESCRRTVVKGRAVLEENLPTDPTHLNDSDRQTLMNNIKDLKGDRDVTACRDTLERTANDLKAIADGSADFATVLNMAGTVCMASGGNPYVCAAAFIVAALLAIFSGGGSGGGGSDSKKGHSSIASDATGGQGKGPEKVYPKPPVTGSIVGGDVGIPCDVLTGTKLSCVPKDTGRVIVLDPTAAVTTNDAVQQSLVEALHKNDGTNLAICSQNADPRVHYLLFFQGPVYFPIGVHSDPEKDGSYLLEYPVNGNNVPPGTRDQAIKAGCSPT